MDITGEVQEEKKIMSAKSNSSLSHVATIADKNNISGKNPCIPRIPSNINVSIATIRVIAIEKPINFPRIIVPRRIGFESMRYMVLPSISRAIILHPIKRTIARPVISIKEKPKSKSMRRVSPRASVSSTSERRTNTTPRNARSPKNLLRIISRKVLSAILNIEEKFLVFSF
jgi:hypothetical protein